MQNSAWMMCRFFINNSLQFFQGDEPMLRKIKEVFRKIMAPIKRSRRAKRVKELQSQYQSIQHKVILARERNAQAQKAFKVYRGGLIKGKFSLSEIKTLQAHLITRNGFVSFDTENSQVQSIFTKYGISNRAQQTLLPRIFHFSTYEITAEQTENKLRLLLDRERTLHTKLVEMGETPQKRPASALPVDDRAVYRTFDD
jgi:hypothetical protein